MIDFSSLIPTKSGQDGSGDTTPSDNSNTSRGSIDFSSLIPKNSSKDYTANNDTSTSSPSFSSGGNVDYSSLVKGKSASKGGNFLDEVKNFFGAGDQQFNNARSSAQDFLNKSSLTDTLKGLFTKNNNDYTPPTAEELANRHESIGKPTGNEVPANSFQNALSGAGLPSHIVSNPITDTIGNQLDDTVDKIDKFIGTTEDTGNPAKNATGAQKLGAGLDAITGVGNLILSPLSALFKEGETVPVLKYGVKAIEYPFQKLSDGVTWASNKAVDALPVSQETKDAVKKPIADILSLVAQVYTGKKVAEHVLPIVKSKVADIKTTLTKDVVTTHAPGNTTFFDASKVKDIWQTGTLLSDAEKKSIIDSLGGDKAKIKDAIQNGTSVEVSPKTLVELQDKPYWAKIKSFFGIENPPETISTTGGESKQTVRGYLPEKTATEPAPTIDNPFPEVTQKAPEEPFVPPEQLKNETTAPAQETTSIPEKQDNSTGKESLQVGDQVTSPVNNEPATISDIQNIGGVPHAKLAGESTYSPLEHFKPTGGGETKSSGLASNTELKAIEQKIIKQGSDSLTPRERMVMKDVEQKATDFFHNDPEQALRVINGEEKPPEGLPVSVLYSKIRDVAYKSKDSYLISQLINSEHINDLALGAGQFVKGFDAFNDRENGTPSTQVFNAIKDIKSALEQDVQSKLPKGETIETAKKKIIAKAEKEITSKVKIPKMKEVEDFINSIKC